MLEQEIMSWIVTAVVLVSCWVVSDVLGSLLWWWRTEEAEED